MSRLIISSLTRLFQRVIFWICFIGMFLYGVFMAFATTPENVLSFSFESCFFGFAPIMGLFLQFLSVCLSALNTVMALCGIKWQLDTLAFLFIYQILLLVRLPTFFSVLLISLQLW